MHQLTEKKIVDSLKINEYNDKFSQSLETRDIRNEQVPSSSIENISDMKRFLDENNFSSISPTKSPLKKEELTKDEKSVHERKKIARTSTDCDICGASFKSHNI